MLFLDCLLKLSAVCFAAALVFAVPGFGTDLDDPAEKFPGSLVGAWHGEAVQTPVGAVPYSIEFTKNTDGCISGTTDTGRANHTWTFCKLDAHLRLHFFTDFGGNETPINFEMTSTEQGVRTFFAKTHGFMQVLITVRENSGWIRIMHRGKLHVEIQLSRQAHSTN